ncbi:MAG: aminopeptidase P family N-terminal domain-containing protein, partial [Clostridia bacterium]|nr:aminopeptidase P family N-terminal domain-containing protein [Clostridia bacterium]
MDTNKLGRIINKMQENGLSQIIVTHPTPIRYLTGLRLWPGERMLALLIRADGNHRFFINRMSQQEDQGIPITYYDDTEDP